MSGLSCAFSSCWRSTSVYVPQEFVRVLHEHHRLIGSQSLIGTANSVLSLTIELKQVGHLENIVEALTVERYQQSLEELEPAWVFCVPYLLSRLTDRQLEDQQVNERLRTFAVVVSAEKSYMCALSFPCTPCLISTFYRVVYDRMLGRGFRTTDEGDTEMIRFSPSSLECTARRDLEAWHNLAGTLGPNRPPCM